MTQQPISIRKPEIDALVAGSMTVLIRPIGQLATLEPGHLLWVREPFHVPKALDGHSPTYAAARGATPTFVTDHSPAWYAHHTARQLGRRRNAREMLKIWHRQHLRILAVDRLQLHDVATIDLRTAGWRSRDRFAARWNESARFSGERVNKTNFWDANPTVLRLVFERIATPLPAADPSDNDKGASDGR